MSWLKGPRGKRRCGESGELGENLPKALRKQVRKTNELVTHSTCLLSRKCHWKGAMFSTCTSSLKFTFCIHLIQKRLIWALAIGHWETIVWRSLKRSISLFSYAQMPKAQLPMTNCQSNFY